MQEKHNTIAELQRSPSDTGSSEVQIALLTSRIHQLTEHLKAHGKDFKSKRGLQCMVSQRKKLLRYLQRTRLSVYQHVIQKLDLRG